MQTKPKIIIIGGVAGGASAAARARRISEDATIVLLERGPHVSFANCGMPYHIGGIISDHDRLLVQTPDSLRRRFRIDVRINTEVLAIHPTKKTIRILDRQTHVESDESYDILILSPGAEPIRPPLPGVELPGIHILRSLEDMDKIISDISIRHAQRALVVGGGFIGLEMAEAFHARGLAVTLVEMAQQVMTPLDPEMAAPIHQQLQLQGVNLKLGVSVTGFAQRPNGLEVRLSSGETLETDIVLLSIGVKPEVKLAKEAGLALGSRDGIRVNEHMQTSDPTIYAVGDAVETVDLVGGFSALLPLAGPANRQGRLAAEHALGRVQNSYRGSQGTSICKIFDLTVASTGLNEKTLKRLEKPYQKIYVHPANHAGYYPGANPMSLKLLYTPVEGHILGAQIVGTDGVDKRIDVLATALRGNMTVFDLEHLELAYAPPYGSAKDPVNYAGFVASNALRGDVTFCHTEDILASGEDQLILDVRTAAEVAAGSIPGSRNIPIDSLRERLGELPENKELLVYCQVGLRSYLAARILQHHGWKTRVLTGGYTTFKAVTGMLTPDSGSPKREIRHDANETPDPARTSTAACIAAQVDARGLQCPGPIIQLGKAIERIQPGEAVHILVSDPGFVTDAPAWCRSTGHRCGEITTHAGYYETTIVKASSSAPVTQTSTAHMKKKTLIVFSCDFDRVMAAFILANGAASMGSEITMFFTFWGLNILRKPESIKTHKTLIERMFGWMMPRGAEKLTLSQLNFGGLGTKMMQHVMKRKQVASLTELIQHARDAGVKLVACTMTMEIMGITREELITGVEEGGVASYLDKAENAGVNLFI